MKRRDLLKRAALLPAVALVPLLTVKAGTACYKSIEGGAWAKEYYPHPQARYLTDSDDWYLVTKTWKKVGIFGSAA